LGGETVADSTRVLILREARHAPGYYFPIEDVRQDLMKPTGHRTHCPHKGDCSYWTLNAGAGQAENAVWAYQDPNPDVAAIKGHVAFYWDKMDAWYEEDEQIFVHARDPYVRIDILDSSRPVAVVLGGETVAETERARFLFETGSLVRYYIPPEDVRMDLLTPTDLVTRCPYKGEASYWTARAGGQEFENIVWGYENPVAEAARIKGYLCFYNEKADAILVDGAAAPETKIPWHDE